MPEFPQPLNRGPAFLVEWGNKLLAAARAARPLRSASCEVHESPDGTQILPRAGGAASFTPRTTHAFEVTNASAGGVAMVRIRSGRINALDAVTAGPFNTGDSPVFTLTVADGHRVYVDVTTGYSAGVWSDTAFDLAAAASVPAATATHAYYPIADVTVEDNVVTAIGGEVAGNIGHRRCGTASVYNDQWGAGA